MKKFFYAAFCCILMLAGCRKETLETVSIEIVSADTEFSAKGGTGKILFKVTGTLSEPVRVESSASWLTILDIAENEASFVLGPSQEAEPRSAVVTLTAGPDSKTVKVSQSVLKFDLEGGDENRLEMDPTGRRAIELTYDASDGIPVSEITYADGGTSQWLDVIVEEGKVTFKAEPNLGQEERGATVVLTSEWISYTVRLNQKFVTSMLSYESFGCDACECVSGRITVADYAVDHLGDWELERDADWYGVARTEDSFTISVQENTTGKDRVGEILIKDAAGTVVSAFKVMQTHFSYENLSGIHVLRFGEGDHWVMDFMKVDGGFAVKAVGTTSDLHKTEGHNLKLAYVSCGDRAPKMVLKLPQMLGSVDGKPMMLYATSPDGYYSLTENLGYELVYSGAAGAVAFDFVTEEAAYGKGFHYGFNGLFLLKDTVGEDWIVPREGQERLRLVKWKGGNHDKFD